MLCEQFGLMQIIAHEEALTILARSVDPRDPSSMLEAVQLLGAICLVPPDGYTPPLLLLNFILQTFMFSCHCCDVCSLFTGEIQLHDFVYVCLRHDKVLEGITVCGEMREQERFTPIVQGVVMDDPNMKVHCVDCIHEQTFIAVCN